MRPRLRWVALLAGTLVLAAVIHYWPGRGLLAHFGIRVGLPDFDLTAPSSFPLADPRGDVPGVPNFARVSEQLYRGAQPTREGFAELQRMGIKTIVNLREIGSDRSEMAGLSMGYLHIRFSPTGPEDEELATFLKLFEDPAQLPAFVHCKTGADRTGTAVAVYRVIQEGWPMAEAVKELPRFGYHEVWTDLLRYLGQFDPDEMLSRLEAQPAPQLREVP
jgi:protein tyrosine phosphatase (PTP) superfamily phosphohydrolase (DUF442 family)